MLEAIHQVPPSHARAELESRIALVDDFEGTFHTAQTEKQQTPAPKTKAKATGNIREHRADELTRERYTAQIPEGVLPDKATLQASTKSDQSNHFAGARSAQIIDMLRLIKPRPKP